MKNKIILLLLLCLFPFVVYANTKSVTVKYTEKSNVTNYKSIITNQSASVLINGKKATFNTTSNVNGKSLVVIKAAGEAYNWISQNNGEGNYYYAGVLINNTFVEGNLLTQLQIDNKLIKVYDSSGSIIGSDKDSVTINNTNIYFSFEDIAEIPKSKIRLIINGKGRVIIDGAIYTESVNLEVEDDSSVIILSDSNYVFTKALINQNNITSEFDNNKLDYSFKENDILEIDFIEKIVEESEDLYTINGYIKKHGVPVSNTTVILHSEERITITDENGFYEFEDVPSGDHELLVVTEEQEALGFIKFNVEKAKDKKTVKSIKNNVTTISVNEESSEIGIDLLINDDYSIEIENVKHVEVSQKESFNPKLLLIVIPVLIVVLLVVIIVKRKDKKTV